MCTQTCSLQVLGAGGGRLLPSQTKGGWCWGEWSKWRQAARDCVHHSAASCKKLHFFPSGEEKNQPFLQETTELWTQSVTIHITPLLYGQGCVIGSLGWQAGRDWFWRRVKEQGSTILFLKTAGAWPHTGNDVTSCCDVGGHHFDFWVSPPGIAEWLATPLIGTPIQGERIRCSSQYAILPILIIPPARSCYLLMDKNL